MALIYPNLDNIKRLKVRPTEGEWVLVNFLNENLDNTYEIFFNPYLDGDRPDIIVLKKGVAAFIIEVKDWDLNKYSITGHNEWLVYNGRDFTKIFSPHAQVFKYKKNLYDLHLPIIGMGKLKNANFFNLVHCFIYFHGSKQLDVNQKYTWSEEKNREEVNKTNTAFKNKEIEFFKYEKKLDYLKIKKTNLSRDKSMSAGSDSLHLLLKKIEKKSSHNLFTEEVYKDFKRRLSPPEHTLKQGIPVNLDKEQIILSVSKAGKEKVRGVAGCGKTTVLASRAINAHERHNGSILILTYNITLKNYIRDKISDLKGKRDLRAFEISNYHQFFNSQINNLELPFDDLIKKHGVNNLYSTDVFKDYINIKYGTILIDEVQDYSPEWVKIIRDNFLNEDGEMILFGDKSQNIYQIKEGRASVIAQGFGSWKILNNSYRTVSASSLDKLFKDFQNSFLIIESSDLGEEPIDKSQIGMEFLGTESCFFKYEKIQSVAWFEDVFNSVKSYMSSHDLHPNDVVILSSKINPIRKLNEFWVEKEKTHCMFETYEELSFILGKDKRELMGMNDAVLNNLIEENKEEVKRVRRVKKNHFHANSGLIKISTIHSYKGLESKTVFYILHEDDEPEMVYTSITRSKENLVIFDIGENNKYSEFFEKEMHEI